MPLVKCISGSLAMAIISPLAGKIYDRIGMKKLAITGAAVLLAGTVAMSLVSMQTPLMVTVFLNILRNIAIGCLLMSFVTWGLGGIDKNETADGTALLNSLRTIAGVIGTAVAVEIMNSEAVKSANAYEDNAGIHGLHVSFLVMSIVAVILFFISVFFIKSGQMRRKEDTGM